MEQMQHYSFFHRRTLSSAFWHKSFLQALFKHDLVLPTSMTNRPGSMPMTKLSSFSSFANASHDKINKRFLTWRSFVLQTQALLNQSSFTANGAYSLLPNRNLAQVRPEPISELWFTASFPAKVHTNYQNGLLKSTVETPSPGSGRDHKPIDERTLRLGKTLRALSPLLPSIFVSPLPNEMLSPSISLHLFPSTHPHLPIVKSRVPCRAALWTAPVAWGSVPIVGNVKVEIMSEKMVRTGYVSAPVVAENESDNMGEEKLVVRWRTEGKRNGNSAETTSAQSLSSSSNEVNRGLSTLLGGSQPLFSKGPTEPFTGLFVFSFDQEGRIASLTIEHADESNGYDKTSRVVTLTDWLLGKARWGRTESGLIPGLAYKEIWCRNNTGENFRYRRRDA